MAWKDVDRPGYFGRKREEIFQFLDKLYGQGNWRTSWKWLGQDQDFRFACNLYEDAYYQDSFNREGIWKKLLKQAKDVWDYSLDDVASGFDYEVQRGNATHLQDIAIRRVVARRGWRFKGDELVQIRGHESYWGNNLSPGKVSFHLLEHILPGLDEQLNIMRLDLYEKIPFTIWWNKHSIEDFYQSNKFLQVRVVDEKNIPGLVDELNALKEQFIRRKDAYENEVVGISILLESETKKAFGKVLEHINRKLEGKAPTVEDFNAQMDYVDLKLNCDYETLGDEGNLIKLIVKEELEKKGFNWIHAGFSPYYYSK